MKKFSRLILVFALVFFLVACGSSDDNASKADEKDKDLIFGLITWPENIAVNYIWKVLLEEKGYNVELNQLDMGIIMESLHTGDLDVGMEVWLPIQDINYYEKYKDTVDFNETPWFTNGKVGLAVPDYLDEINSVEDLNEHKDLFDGEIIGFEPGAGTMDTTDLLIEDYDLDYELVASSEGAMVAAIKDAFDNEEPIVAPLWQPHGIFSDVDLKFLEDPKETYGEIEEIFLAKRDGFAEDHPEVNEWLTNWSIDDDDLDYELVASSEGAMVAAIKDAFDNEEPIVAPLWQPHGIFSDVDLKFLEDPKETYGEIEEIFLAKRDGFAEDHPEVNEWLTNWSIDDDEIMAELINFVNEDEDHYEGAKKWVEENRDITDEWVK